MVGGKRVYLNMAEMNRVGDSLILGVVLLVREGGERYRYINH